jgi:CsoR family transcriptional regulator, copper-sensing transcriptional repressor
MSMDQNHTHDHAHAHNDAMVRDKDDLLRRLRRIEGQVKGLQRMVESDRYCVDVLNQLAAVKAALNKVGLSLLESHSRGCVRAAIQRGEGDQAVDELVGVMDKFMRSGISD